MESRLLETTQKLLALRPHTCWELERKLRRKGFEGKAVAKIIAQAIEAGWLDDRETAVLILEEQARRGGHGRRWIHGKLLSKGIEPSLAVETIAGNWSDEREREEILRFLARYRGWNEGLFSDRESLLKCRRALASRGFDAEIVRSVLAGAAESLENGEGD